MIVKAISTSTAATCSWGEGQPRYLPMLCSWLPFQDVRSGARCEQAAARPEGVEGLCKGIETGMPVEGRAASGTLTSAGSGSSSSGRRRTCDPGYEACSMGT